MDFFEVVEKRRSVRKFTTDSVPSEVIHKALDSALLAPNSSNIQPWEFYWVRHQEKKSALVEACFSQGAAATAQELIVVVCRLDTWRRNRDWLLASIEKNAQIPVTVKDYYKKLVPISYQQDVFGVLAVFKKIVFTLVGLFRPSPRKPAFRSELFEVVAKTTALACENLMLALVAQGFDSCPMEGFDEVRVKRILKLGRQSQIVMVIGIGKADAKGVFGDRLRIPREWVVHEA
jgi:nitroreductase